MDNSEQAEANTTHPTDLTNALSASYKLIDKLSVLNKGYSKETDNQFAKLRKVTTKPNDRETIDPLIKSVSTSVNKIQSEQLRAFSALLQVSLEAGQALQKTKGIEDNTRRELRMLVNKLKSGNIDTFAELQTIVVNLFNVFSRVKNSQEQSPNANQFDISSTIKTLLHGLEKLAQNGLVIPMLEASIANIYKSTSPREQLELALKTYTAIVDQFGDEFRQTQKLIININKALEDVHKAILNSLKRSKSYDRELSKLNEQIETQIAELSTDVSEAKTVKELQQLVSNKLEAITESIKQRDDIELKRSTELDQSLSALEKKLTKMEERTNFYRNKWIEEKSRSETDALTNLPNRGAYDKRIDEEIHRWTRHKSPLTLAVIDIDHFKKINDTYGHTVGDKTLKIVAKTLKNSLRTSDYLARYGGEEFVCILVDTDFEESKQPLEKVRKSIESLPFIIKSKRINMTVSIGATLIKETDDIHSLFDRADKALYQAKSTGRNKLCYVQK
jgi:diguanylate cyclase (GGDEF)-like protein